MRAACLHELGGTLQLESVADPSPAEEEVLVEIAYASVNPLDVWITQGSIGAAAQHLPWIPGTEGTGYTDDGRPVLVSGGGVGVLRPGLYCEQAAVPRAAVTEVAEGVDLAQLAGLGVAGVTAWASLHDRAQLGPDDRVLVLGASGGVGSLAVPLAQGTAATVWGQTTQTAKVPVIEAAGADRVVVADAGGLADAVAELQPTLIMDGVGGAFTAAAVEVLAPRGRIVVYGTSADQVASLNLRVLYRKNGSILGYGGMVLPEDKRAAILAGLVAMVADGSLTVPVELVPLADAARCHQRILDREVTGKLVLDTHA
jgi:NADPH2:quinone reductase